MDRPKNQWSEILLERNPGAWICVQIVKGDGETQFTKQWIPELTFLWMQYHWELFQLAEHPFHIHLSLCKGTEAWS